MKSVFQISSLQEPPAFPASLQGEQSETMSEKDGQIYQPSYWRYHFPSFIFQKLLDETSNSLIWRGYFQNDPLPIALKITQRFQTHSSQKYHQQTENQFVRQHHLQNMAQVIQLVQSESYRLMAMKLYPWNLTHILKKFTAKTNKKFTQQHIQFVIYAFKSILSAVEELHGIGYVHRDLKPDNFLVDAQFTIVMSDFGLVTKQLEIDQSISGTFQYLPPQRLSKKRRQSPIRSSVDIWALGIILYELFTSDNPFKGETQHQILQSICQGYALDKRMPEEAKDLVKSILQVNVQKRLSLEQIKNHPFLQRQADKTKILAILQAQN